MLKTLPVPGCQQSGVDQSEVEGSGSNYRGCIHRWTLVTDPPCRYKGQAEGDLPADIGFSADVNCGPSGALTSCKGTHRCLFISWFMELTVEWVYRMGTRFKG